MSSPNDPVLCCPLPYRVAPVACELDSDNDVVHRVRPAQTERRQMFEEGEPFNGFPEGCQEYSVPSRLRALVIMVLEGPSIKDQMADTTPAILANAGTPWMW